MQQPPSMQQQQQLQNSFQQQQQSNNTSTRQGFPFGPPPNSTSQLTLSACVDLGQGAAAAANNPSTSLQSGLAQPSTGGVAAQRYAPDNSAATAFAESCQQQRFMDRRSESIKAQQLAVAAASIASSMRGSSEQKKPQRQQQMQQQDMQLQQQQPQKVCVDTARGDGRTTLMLRNLPQPFSRADLLRLLDSQGLAGRYNFVYLPFDFDTLTNLTHAFVNLCSPADATLAWKTLFGFSDWAKVDVYPSCLASSDIRIAIAWNDKQQGLPSLIARYRNSPVMHRSVKEECKPIIFSGGVEMPFPAPTEALKMPKFRRKAINGIEFGGGGGSRRIRQHHRN
jgi:hypothetical protein